MNVTSMRIHQYEKALNTSVIMVYTTAVVIKFLNFLVNYTNKDI